MTTTALHERDRRPLATAFDTLVETNLRLTQSVERLVQVTYVVVACTAIFAILTILSIWGHR